MSINIGVQCEARVTTRDSTLRHHARRSWMHYQAAARAAVVKHWTPGAKPSRKTSREIGRRFDRDVWPVGADASVAMPHVQQWCNTCRRIQHKPTLVAGEDALLRQMGEYIDEIAGPSGKPTGQCGRSAQ